MPDLPPQDLSATPDAPWWRQRAAWIYEALLAGELSDHLREEVTAYPIAVESLGELELPGGRFVACDPYVTGEEEVTPLTQTLGVDRALVLAARATVGPAHERVAALILRAGDQPIREWQMAMVGSQDPATLKGDGFFGYPVDAGTGSFGSPEAMVVATRVSAADEGMLEDPMSLALFEDNIGTRSAVLVAQELGAVPIAVCSSGWGDGLYPTWLGVDESGEIMVAVTDFMVAVDPFESGGPSLISEPTPLEQPTPIEAPDALPTGKSWLQRLFGR